MLGPHCILSAWLLLGTTLVFGYASALACRRGLDAQREVAHRQCSLRALQTSVAMSPLIVVEALLAHEPALHIVAALAGIIAAGVCARGWLVCIWIVRRG